MNIQKKLPLFLLVVGAFVLLQLSGPAWAKTYAKVNGKEIGEKELNLSLSGFNETQRQNILKDQNARKDVIENAIDEEVLAQNAKQSKLNEKPEFKEAMAAFERQVLANLMLQKKWTTSLTPEAVRKYYENHLPRYTTDQAHILQILLSSEEEAQKLLKIAKDPKADFQSLAEKYSRDPSAKNNRGDLGFVTRDRFVEEFTDPVFAAKAGEVIGPIRTLFGYHLVKVLERRSGKVLEFAEVETRARESLRQQLARGYARELRRTAKIEIDSKSSSQD